jgi:methylase of polypeptide subunit release factors
MQIVAKEPDYETAMALAVGGSYNEAGMRGRRLLDALGLQNTHYVIDVGAGSGPLANALKDLPKLRYLGTDVVSELLKFAQRNVVETIGLFSWSTRLRYQKRTRSRTFLSFSRFLPI